MSVTTELLAQAVQAFRVALEVRTKANLPQDWAKTQFLLGSARYPPVTLLRRPHEYGPSKPVPTAYRGLRCFQLLAAEQASPTLQIL